MRRLSTGTIVLLALAAALTQSQAAFADFHCMRIHAVMAGFNGNNNIQYVELRMNAEGQNLVSGIPIKFYDSAGTLKATFSFPSSTGNAALGDSILIATQEFNNVSVGADADFVFSMSNTVGANGGDPLHPVQRPSGKVTFAEGALNCPLVGATTPVDSLAYGNFTGTVDYGTAAAALPDPSDNRALRLNNLNSQPTNNSTEYSLQPVSDTSYSVLLANLATDPNTPRNNGRTVARMPVDADADLDGFRDSIEIHAGTDPNRFCSADNTANNEEPDARPTDFNDDRAVTGADLSAIAGNIGTTVPPSPVRKDIAPDPTGDNAITGADLSRVAGVIGTAC